ncbi:M56 family metallopeptidase [Streptomyces triculaminicus]|uniref:M56 family metallopeptidase n=1 Tax=Streptomyces triculaminicus TaxID=2816232 RepID=A0A939FKJ3_9ACTN|nr:MULTISPECIES: M56 family metallopeptidase [Streptomyces]MBO0653720.1 M56 family metallopeptidase [Streptomyces triculaminicus]
MIALLLLPLVLPWMLPPLARRAVERVRPEIALWTVTTATAALAVGVVACLGALLLPLALAIPPLAALAELIQPLQAGPRLAVLGVSVLAAGLLAVTVVTVVRHTTSEARRLRAAHREVSGLPHAGGLCVLEDPRPDAYALPPSLRRPGRIVVTTGMLRSLDPREREALLAHERAHLAGHHHVFLAAAQLAGWCHPALAAVAPHVSLAAERAADERAARAVDDRTLTAQAVGRAALAATRGRERGPSVLAARAVTGPVPARVKALLTQAPARRLAPALLAIALLCTAAGTSSVAGTVLLHRGVEIAQGEQPSD